jgi:uncharacterized protein (DUF58 family)
MLYPELDELISYKDLKLGMEPPARCSSRSLALGGQYSPFRGQGLEFDAVRKYVPGDDIRAIDWRVTARTGSPHIKIFHEERQRHILLCIDMNAGMRFGTRGTFKSVQAARAASLLGWQAVANHDRISACLFGDVPGGIEFFTPKQSRMSLLQLLKRLSQASTEQSTISFVKALDRTCHAAPTGSLVYFISDFMEGEEEGDQKLLLNRLKQRCDVVFISINDPADKALIPIGKINVSSHEGDKIMINTDSVSGRETYALQWEENRKRIHQKTSQLGIPLIELTTQSDIKKDLWLALKSLSKGRRR